jgi:hypothetical protein
VLHEGNTDVSKVRLLHRYRTNTIGAVQGCGQAYESARIECFKSANVGIAGQSDHNSTRSENVYTVGWITLADREDGADPKRDRRAQRGRGRSELQVPLSSCDVSGTPTRGAVALQTAGSGELRDSALITLGLWRTSRASATNLIENTKSRGSPAGKERFVRNGPIS